MSYVFAVRRAPIRSVGLPGYVKVGRIGPETGKLGVSLKWLYDRPVLEASARSNAGWSRIIPTSRQVGPQAPQSRYVPRQSNTKTLVKRDTKA